MSRISIEPITHQSLSDFDQFSQGGTSTFDLCKTCHALLSFETYDGLLALVNNPSQFKQYNGENPNGLPANHYEIEGDIEHPDYDDYMDEPYRCENCGQELSSLDN